MEQLEYENIKLRIENERLKKGYSKDVNVNMKVTALAGSNVTSLF